MSFLSESGSAQSHPQGRGGAPPHFAEHSERLAEHYRTAAAGVSAFFQDAFENFYRILDVGCGSGRDLCRLLQLGHDATGTDACPEMLATADPLSGFQISDLKWASESHWVEVPHRWAGKNRFVIRITGDSMEPELKEGDWVIFEYHRTPRAQNQVVIPNIAAFGIVSDLATTHAVKRLVQDSETWIFHSTNPSYEDIRISRSECAYPILGIMVGRLDPRNKS